MPVDELSLGGEWSFRKSGEDKWYGAVVPGCSFLDLMRNGIIPDPFHRDNEEKVQWVNRCGWIYRKKFTFLRKAGEGERVFLECDGLDTLSTVKLNNHTLGETDNMFIPWRFDVTDTIADDNVLEVEFRPAVVDEKDLPPDVSRVADGLQGGPIFRRAAYFYGWDWGPRLSPTGIWKDIRLCVYRYARIEDVWVRQKTSHKRARLQVKVEVERFDGKEKNVTAYCTLKDPDGGTAACAESAVGGNGTLCFRFDVDDPLLWYPAGLGEQPLYTIEVELRDGTGTLLDEKTCRIGLRDLKLQRKKDDHGESFRFIVNGIPLFAKGANWIPADSFPPRVRREKYRQLLSDAVQANMNMIRVWGGGFYESDDFYELCDELGLLVWQDFMFACRVYRSDGAFLRQVADEVEKAVRRLRNHPCIALWCGNNEMEWGWSDWGWKEKYPPSAHRAYKRMFEKVLPRVVAREDPDRAYWPSSPSSGTPRRHPNDTRYGNVHFWEVWHKGKPFEAYTEITPRFITEFGFQALPSMETIKSFTTPEDRNLTSPVMESHQKNRRGNSLILQTMARYFRIPEGFEKTVVLSQIQQAEAIRIAVEHFRRNSNVTGGALYWQLNDCWPVISWSSIDYHGRWKALHYAAKRFFAPVAASCLRAGEEFELWGVNDTPNTFIGTLRWILQTTDGGVLKEDTLQVKLPRFKSKRLARVNVGEAAAVEGADRLLIAFELSDGEGNVSRGMQPMLEDKRMQWRKPGISWETNIRGDVLEVVIHSRYPARFVYLETPGTDTKWSDNFFHMASDETYIVHARLPMNVHPERIVSRLRVRSLRDTYR